jgi:hypothetical protein
MNRDELLKKEIMSKKDTIKNAFLNRLKNQQFLQKMKGEYTNEKYRNDNCLCVCMDCNRNSCNFCN